MLKGNHIWKFSGLFLSEKPGRLCAWVLRADGERQVTLALSGADVEDVVRVYFVLYL